MPAPGRGLPGFSMILEELLAESGKLLQRLGLGVSPARPGRKTAGSRGGRAARCVRHDTAVPNAAEPPAVRLARGSVSARPRSRIPPAGFSALRARIPHAALARTPANSAGRTKPEPRTEAACEGRLSVVVAARLRARSETSETPGASPPKHPEISPASPSPRIGRGSSKRGAAVCAAFGGVRAPGHPKRPEISGRGVGAAERGERLRCTSPTFRHTWR